MTIIKLMAAIALAASLAGCGNAVTSIKPLFSERDARGLDMAIWY